MYGALPKMRVRVRVVSDFHTHFIVGIFIPPVCRSHLTNFWIFLRIAPCVTMFGASVGGGKVQEPLMLPYWSLPLYVLIPFL